MKAVVVYESHWGNTAAVARAIAEGIGPEARAMTTDEASPPVVAQAELLVVGAPVIGFSLPRDGTLAQLPSDAKGEHPADVSHPLVRTWLDSLAPRSGQAAAFETRIWWSLRGATTTIEGKLRGVGCQTVAKGERFVVKGTYGPLREGELARARAWGEQLGRTLAR